MNGHRCSFLRHDRPLCMMPFAAPQTHADPPLSNVICGTNAMNHQKREEHRMLNLQDALKNSEQFSSGPSVESLSYVAQHCIKLKNLTYARRVHVHALANGVETDSTLGDRLVPMFIHCGEIHTAQQIFHRLPEKSVYLWAYLTQAFVFTGDCHQALLLYETTKEGGVLPNKSTLQTLLKVCSQLRFIGQGKKIHREIVMMGLDTDAFLGSGLLDMYAKMGFPEEAQVVFNWLIVRDVVVWTALISGYSENGQNEKALHAFQQMQAEGVPPNSVTFLSSLKASGNIRDMGKGQEIHAQIAKCGLDKDHVIGSALVDMYCNCALLVEAQHTFDGLQTRDVVLWTALIAGYADCSYSREIISFIERMELDGISPNAVTCVCCLKSCSSLRSIVKGKMLHSRVTKMGFDNDGFVNTALVDMYAKGHDFAEAKYVFHNSVTRDLVSWNALIAGFAEHNHDEEAVKCLEEMQTEHLHLVPDTVTYVCALKACGNSGLVGQGQKIHADIARDGLEVDPSIGISLLDMYAKCGLLTDAQEVLNEVSSQDVVSWNALISGYVEHGLGQEALDCLETMYVEGIPLDAITVSCGLKACIITGAMNRGRWIYSQAIKQGLIEADPIVHQALVDMYAKCNSMVEAQAVFDELQDRGLMPWGAFLMGYACNGESRTVFKLFEQMVKEAIQPDGIAFVSLLTVCSHDGLVEEGLSCLNSLVEECVIAPSVAHCNCIIDLFCRAGQLDQVISVLEKMPFQPNIVTWSTILSACRKNDDMALARQAFESASKLKDTDGTPFILMASIYADHNLWQGVEQLKSILENLD